MKMIFLILKIVLGTALLFGLYVAGNIIYATLTDYKPPLKETIEVENVQSLLPADSVFSFLIWNIGYGGLGAKDDFFYDGGQTVVSPKANVNEYLEGIKGFIKQHDDKDFILLQEVDRDAKRSYGIDQLKLIATALPKYAYSYAPNYKVNFIPIPYISPLGRVNAGLGTYSKHALTEATRYQLPGSFPWPKSVYFLDRCILVNRVPLENGKDLVVVNIHNSAYDDTGEMKAAEMAFIKEYLQKEFSQGNYLVVGGDWNQSPPKWNKNTYTKSGDDYAPDNIDKELMPPGWWWMFDPTSPTNRNLKTAYNPETTSCTVIDFYLISPNIEVLEVKTHNLNFAYSDHQPVSIKIKLR
jgi:endonuclease/exonuclease/phosphatase family metal-dependent hydrolase